MIKIIVDSASDVDVNEAVKLGVNLIPLQVRFGQEEFLDGVNLSHREFFEKLIESNELPQTSQINEFRWGEIFEKETRDDSEVIAITISSKLSGTYSCAKKAAKAFSGRVWTVDSLNASIGERILMNYALDLVRKGELKAEDIVKELDERKRDIKLLAVLDTLKYLRKGGRISSVAAFTGELLSIKPVIALEKGEVKLAGKAIGSKKGNNLLMQLVGSCGGINFGMPYAVAYSGLNDAYLQKYLKDSESLWKGKAENIPSYMIGSTIGTHIGPGAIAVAFFANRT